MKILALNSGSSSIKYGIFDSQQNYHLLQHGTAERIGQNESCIRHKTADETTKEEKLPLPDHRTALQRLFTNEKDLNEIEAVGHRVVHGGEHFKAATLVTKEVVAAITALAELAPLHCQPNIVGIEAMQQLLPNVPQAAVFDTAAHASMDFKAFLYGLPLEYYENYKIRKYGFHGINHAYVAQEAAYLSNRKLVDLKLVTCHLGNGCSITAFEKGKSIDNSMGFTPLEGLVMGTRCGDIDPAAITYLIDKLKIQPEQINDLLNKKSGLLGLCGKNDMRDIIAMAKNGERAAQITIDVFVYRIQKYIGAYIAALNGIDAIVFTAGIGENSSCIRSLILKNFSYMGIQVDDDANERNKSIFSTGNSAIFLLNIAANEEKAIARQTHQIVSRDIHT